jgi:ammonia channel protein AmtB
VKGIFVIDTGDTAWMLISTGLVLFMTPGLAFFYGGMVRAKNVLGMLMQNFFAMGLMAIIWVTIAFSLAFGNFGDPQVGMNAIEYYSQKVKSLMYNDVFLAFDNLTKQISIFIYCC